MDEWVLWMLAAVAAASLLALRPIARRHLRTPVQLRSGTAALIGAPAIVLERVDGRGGQVKIGGEIWSARSFDEDETFEPGALPAPPRSGPRPGRPLLRPRQAADRPARAGLLLPAAAGHHRGQPGHQ